MVARLSHCRHAGRDNVTGIREIDKQAYLREKADSTSRIYRTCSPTYGVLASNTHNAMSNVRELLWQDPLHMIAGALYEFVPGPYQNLHREDNGLGTFLLPEAPQLALAYQQLLSNAPRIDGDREKGSPPSVYPDSSLERKLQRLKQIRDDGLITEDEYAAKKKALLDEF